MGSRDLTCAADLLVAAFTLGRHLEDSAVVKQAEERWPEAQRIAYRRTLAGSDAMAVILVLLTAHLRDVPGQSQSDLARALCYEDDGSQRQFTAMRWRVGKIITRLEAYGLLNVTPREKHGLADNVRASEALVELFKNDLAPRLVEAAHQALGLRKEKHK